MHSESSTTSCLAFPGAGPWSFQNVQTKTRGSASPELHANIFRSILADRLKVVYVLWHHCIYFVGHYGGRFLLRTISSF
jgi:hypothetical protein